METKAEQLVDLLPDEKRTLLTRLLQQKAATIHSQKNDNALSSPSIPTIEPVPQARHEPFPLTDIQQAYWVGRSAAYELGDISIHAYSEVDCTNLDLKRLMAAWERVVRRHDMLRVVVLPDGRQQILDQVPAYEFQIHDLRGKTANEVTATLDAIRTELSHQVLPSDRWPAFDIRASLLDHGRIRLHISIDLLHVDGGSLMILNDEWVQFYEDPDLTLPLLELSYRDYALAAAALKESNTYQRSLAYWQDRVKVLPGAPELPAVQNPSALVKTRFVHRSARLEAPTWQRLKEQATRLGLTPSSVLLAAYAEILASWAKHPDFTINVTLFNRLPLHPQVNAILGDFTSMILLGVNNPAGEPFTNRARQIQRQLWTDLEHRTVSGIETLRELARWQGPQTSALMPIVFTSLLDLGAQGFRSPTLSLGRLGEVVYSVTQTPQVWLDYQVLEENGSLIINWDAVEEIFPPDLLDDMLAAYCCLLQRLAHDDLSWQDTRHTHVPPAHLAQRAAVNATNTAVPNGTLYTFFLEQVRARPQETAVIATGKTLTYGELHRRANQVGRQLRAWGTQPDTLVAIVMEKGWEQVVAAVGIHAAGAAYLPIDASLPKERLWYLLEHSQAQIALTQSWLDSTLEWPPHVRRLCLDNGALGGLDDSPLDPVQQASNLSHVIYTSGSTGLPKGVMIEHGNVVNRMIDVNQRQHVGRGDRVLALTALHHDLSVYDIFGTLMAGGAMVIPDADKVRDPAHWAELMVREQVTIWNSVPAFLEMLVEYLEHLPDPEPLLPESLRWAILAGDWIPVSLPDRLRALVNGVQIIASGGPTETTIWDIWYPVGQVDPAWKSIPYGKPMANARYHVLNDVLEPCPVWAPGQLYIAGKGVARGYWRDEEKTQAQFITHPQTGERLYRSGDMGRFLPDGNIEFLGREDFQLQIRGYRVELGEIETALQQHPAVRAAVVNAVGELRGHKRLVAYVVPTQAYATAVFQPQSPPHPTNVQELLQEFEKYQIPGVELLDPVARIEFKMSQLGLRHDDYHPAIPLNRPEQDENLRQLYTSRRSYREFVSEPVPFSRFSEFLNCLAYIELDGLPKYRYASAGGLYPVQTYLHVKPDRIEGIDAGLYYYHPQEHQLHLLTAVAEISRDVHAPNNRSIFDQSAFSLFFIGRQDAITPMYGQLARDFSLLEAGYMSQLIMMEAARMGGLGLCPIGDMKFEPIRPLFDLEDNDILLHSFLGGRINAGQANDWSTGQKSFIQKASPNGSPAANGNLAGDLRRFLASKLPEPMVPAIFMFLETLPLTTNGKVNRRALPEPEADHPEAEAVYAPPETDVEQTLTSIVQAVLEVGEIGIHHNFFDLGGNSVHMVQILNKVRETFQRELPITEIFRHPTIRAMATYLSQEPEEANAFRRGDERAQARQTAASRRADRKRRRQNR